MNRAAIALATAVSLSPVGAAPGADFGPAPIELDLDRLDAAGLQGPPDGLRALDYEYCIPTGAGPRAQIAAIDPTARFMPGSRGRVGCGADQVLVLGSTHQPGFREVLARLAALPFVARIGAAHFE